MLFSELQKIPSPQVEQTLCLKQQHERNDDLSTAEGANCTYSPAQGAGRALPFTFMRPLVLNSAKPAPLISSSVHFPSRAVLACILSKMLDVFFKWN